MVMDKAVSQQSFSNHCKTPRASSYNELGTLFQQALRKSQPISYPRLLWQVSLAMWEVR